MPRPIVIVVSCKRYCCLLTPPLTTHVISGWRKNWTYIDWAASSLPVPIQHWGILIELTSISSAYFGTKSSPGRPSSSMTSPAPLVRRKPGTSVCGSVFPAPRFATSWNSSSASFSSVASGSDKDDRSSSEMPQPLRQKERRKSADKWRFRHRRHFWTFRHTPR